MANKGKCRVIKRKNIRHLRSLLFLLIMVKHFLKNDLVPTILSIFWYNKIK